MAKATQTTTAPNKTSGALARKRAATAKDKDKGNGASAAEAAPASKPRLGPPARLRGTLVRGLAQLRKRYAKIDGWKTDDKDHAEILGDATASLAEAKEHYAAAIDHLAELPEDFKPRGKSKIDLEPGEIVVLRESKQKVNKLALEDVAAKLTVVKVDCESKRILCTTEAGERWFGPVTDVKRA